MKAILISIGFMLASVISYGQQMQDDNSAIINAYFKQSIPKKAPVNSSGITQIFQQGNYNHVEANTTNKDNLKISQKGNQNFAALLSFYSTTALNLTILQTGNNNGIHIFGENNLIKNAVIRQDASNQHIIISNY